MPDAGWDSLVRQAADLQAQGADTASQLKESAGRERDIATRLADMKPPAAPELKEPAPPPDPSQLPNPLTSFGSIAAALGMLGSLMTRRPLMTALNAATGAIVGAREGNQAEFKRQYDIWKEQSEYADKVQTWQTNRYKMIMDQYKTNVDQMLNALNVEALANKDLVAANMLQKGDLQLFENLMMDRANLHLRQQEVGLRMAEARPLLDANMDYETARKELVAARNSRDPAKIKAATDKVNDALMNVYRVHQGISGTTGLRPEQDAYAAFLLAHPNATPEQRAAFLKSMRATTDPFAALMAAQGGTQQAPAAPAPPPASVSADVAGKSIPLPPAPGQPGASVESPARPTTEEEYNALPQGAYWEDADGNVRQKGR